MQKTTEILEQLFNSAAAESDPLQFLGRALPLVGQAMESDYVAVVQGARGRWRTIASWGPMRPLPTELFSEALDTGQRVERGDWLISPLSPQTASGELLAAYEPRKPSSEREQKLDVLRQWLATALEQVRARHRDKQ